MPGVVEISPYLRRPLRSVPDVLAEHGGLNPAFRNGQSITVKLAGGGELLRGRVLCALKHDLLVVSDRLMLWVPDRLATADA